MLALPYRNYSAVDASRIAGLSDNAAYSAMRNGCPCVRQRATGYGKLFDPSEIKLFLGRMARSRASKLPGVLLEEICKEYQVTRSTVRRWEQRGMPYHNTRPRKYDPTACREWFIENIQAPVKRKWLRDGIDMRPGLIYGIYEPGAKWPRYIGKTDDFPRRIKGHLKTWEGRDKKCAGSHSGNWLMLLHRKGIKPEFKVLQECLPGMLDIAEQEWIARGRAKGWKLTNCREGGESGAMSEATKARLSDYSKAKWQDPEYVKRWEAGTTHLRLSPEVRAERQAQRQRNLAIHARNMQIAAERKAGIRPTGKTESYRRKHGLTHGLTNPQRDELFATLTYVCIGDVAFVPLTNDKYAKIDRADMEEVKQHVWFANINGKRWRARRKQSVTQVQGLGRYITNEQWPCVNHRNGDQLDCRRSNLIHGKRRGRVPTPGPSKVL